MALASLIFPYPNHLVFDRDLRLLNSTDAGTVLAAYTAMQFLSFACYGAWNTSDLGVRLTLLSGCFVCIKSNSTDLVHQVNICSIIHGSGFDTVTFIFAQGLMRLIGWNSVSIVASSGRSQPENCSGVSCCLVLPAKPM